MGAGELFLMSMLLGAAIGFDIILWVGGLVWFFGVIYVSWQRGRQLAQSVTERAHQQRVERIVRMIELEQAGYLIQWGKHKARQRGET